MGRGATLSILGLYNFDSTIFDGISLPDGFLLEALKNQILFDCAELEIIYPDPDAMKLAISIWSRGEQQAFRHIAKMINAEYSPIENTDRYEDRNVMSTPNFQTVTNSTDTQAATAYNSDSFKDTGKNTVSGITSSTGSGTLHDVAHVHGNIGVTTNQQMISDEKAMILAGYNFYQIVSDMFKRRFCIRLY